MKITIYSSHLLMVLIGLSFVFQSSIYAQSLESKVDSLLQEKYKSNAPGATFLISKNGKIIYKKAFGLSNLELNLPMHTENVFEIASITKQFTAIAILMLMEKGKLNLDDQLSTFIPDYPTNGYKITIHHLLTHTSGIKDFTRVKGLNAIATQQLAPLDLIDFFKNEPMDFAPGEEMKYNNSGYILLGYIIEKVSGQSYASFVEDQIFKKLGMKSSIYGSHREVIKNRASGYHNKGRYVNRTQVSHSFAYSAGGLMSNVNDMFIWQEAIKNNLLIKKKTTKKAFTNYTLNNGEAIDYGYGWHLKELNRIPTREHGGHFFGFKSMGVYLPEQDIYVIGLNNCDCNSPTTITREIAVLTSQQ